MFMNKSKKASLSGLELRLHTKSDPKMKYRYLILLATQLPHFSLVGIVTATNSKLPLLLPPSPPLLFGDTLIARHGPSAHLSQASSWGEGGP